MTKKAAKRSSSQESYRPSNRKKKTAEYEISNFNQKKNFKWEEEHQKKYLIFLIMHQTLFENSLSRRKNKIFNLMSKELINKTSDQCRSHHQKMLKKYKTVSQTIQKLRQTYGVKELKDFIEAITQKNRSHQSVIRQSQISTLIGGSDNGCQELKNIQKEIDDIIPFPFGQDLLAESIWL